MSETTSDDMQVETVVEPIEGNETPIIKEFISEMKADTEEESFVATITTEAVDRHQEVVIAKGIHLERYLGINEHKGSELRARPGKGNPVVFYGHASYNFPIAKTLWVKTKGKSLIAKAVPADTEEGRDAFNLIKGGFLNATSIGFDPFAYDNFGPPTEKELEKNIGWAKVRTVFRESDLMEWSVVGVPANPEALISAVNKGMEIRSKAFYELFELDRKPNAFVVVPEKITAVKRARVRVQRGPVLVSKHLNHGAVEREVQQRIRKMTGKVL